MSHAPILIHLFGPPEFRVKGEPVTGLKTRKGYYILALLALRYDRDVARAWLAGILWPENDEAAALTYLRQALTDLRRALGDAAGRLLSPTAKTLRLDIGDGADIDYVTFRQGLRRDDTAALEQAISLYRGPLLEGWTEDWLLSERETCAQGYLSALETLAQAKEGDNAATIRYLREIVAIDPLRESASRGLMQALATTRDYAAVTQVYRNLRTVLRREINAEPSPETQALFARLRADAKIQATVVSRVDVEKVPEQEEVEEKAPRLVQLPRPLSEFIGRRREGEMVKRALSTSRLVTLTGIGGVGKTRLSIRVAEEVADDFPEGVRFVDLSPVIDPALVAKTAAVALGVADQSTRSVTEAVCEQLRECHLLLILDNCEHLPEACAHFAFAVLQACPSVRILVTSRQQLGITGETVRRILPLTLPDLKLLTEEDKNADTALLEYESVRLFVDRALRVQPNLVLNQHTLRSIAVLCHHLDGIPLALELAAARTSALEPEQITARLKERFRLLSGGDRTASARQRTLRGALDWSHDLLQPEEKILLRRLSIFAGGWTLEAAEEVCAVTAESGLPVLEEWEVLDCLTGLVNHSLVNLESGDGPARYRLLETVREYAQERLRESSADEVAGLRKRHRDYFLHLVQEALPHLGAADQVLWMDRLQRDYDNLRATLDGCLEDGTTEAIRIGLEIAASLRRFWLMHGHVSEGRRRYTALLSRDPEVTPERGRALESAGILAYRQMEYAVAQELLYEALRVHQQIGDRYAEALPLNVLGSIACEREEYQEARSILEQSLALRREAGNLLGEAAVLNTLGMVANNLEEFSTAQTVLERALAICQEVGDKSIEASVLNRLGIAADGMNDFMGARARYEQALARNREIGDFEQMMGNLYNLAHNADRQGNTALAEEQYRQVLLLIRDPKTSPGTIAFSLKGLAITAQKRSLPERAARLLGASDAQLEILGATTPRDELGEYNQLQLDLNNALGTERFAALRAEGRLLRLDQAIAVGLEQ